MGFRQTYKGIFQFKDQETLEMAMYENMAEAMGADAMGLQDSFHGEGVMLLNIDAVAKAADWEEMGVALATLAMHAYKGFVYAVSYDPELESPLTEYFEANGEGSSTEPEAGSTVLPKDDYFPMLEGAHYVFRSRGQNKTFDWTTHAIEAHGRKYLFFKDDTATNVHFNEYWEHTYHYKVGNLVGTVAADTEEELRNLSPDDPYSSQTVYNNNGQPEDMLYSIWKTDNVFVILTQEEFETVRVPLGEFQECMKVKVELYHVENDSLVVRAHYQYFAKGIGLVKWKDENEILELVEFSS